MLDAGEDAIAQVDTLESLEAAEAVEAPQPEPKEETKPEDKRPTGYQRVKARLERTEAELAELRATKATQPEAAPTKPKLEDFKDYDTYYEAMAEYKADQRIEQKLKDRESKSREDDLRKEGERKVKAFTAKAEEFKKSVTDFDEKLEDSGLLEMADKNPILGRSLIEAEPDVAYYLANHPEELKKLEGLNYGETARAIGRIEARLEKSEESTVKTTKAPAPLSVPRGNGNTESVNPYNNHEMTGEQWRAYKAKLNRK